MGLRIGLFGVAGVNRGDDAIALSLIEGFSSQRPETEFVVAVLQPTPSLEGPRVRQITINRRSPLGLLRLARAILAVDCVILGGGSLIQDKLGGTRTRGVLGYAWTISLLARFLGKTLLTAPLGIDDLETDSGKGAARETLERLNWLAVRDEASATNARKICSDRIKADVFCDPVFRFSSSLRPRGDYFVLAPAFEGKEEDHIIDLFAAVAHSLLLADASSRIAIVAMDQRTYEDGGKISAIRERIGAHLRDRVTLCRPDTAQEAAGLLRASKGVIAMRLHALILAYGFVNIFCISRTTKTDALIYEYLVPGIRLDRLGPLGDLGGKVLDEFSRNDLVKEHGDRRQSMEELLSRYYSTALSFIK